MICRMIRRSLCCLTLLTIVLTSLARGAVPTTAPFSVEVRPTQLTQGQRGSLILTVDIPPGLHAQSHTPSAPNYIPFNVTMTPNTSVRFTGPAYPPGEDHTYGQLGILNVYTGRVRVEVPFQVADSAPAGPLKIEGKLQYQMCDDRSCYAPQRPKFEAQAQVVGTPASAPTSAPTATIAPPPPAPVVPSGPMTAWAAFGSALLAGLLF